MKLNRMRSIVYFLFFVQLLSGCLSKKITSTAAKENEFSFLFMTDIHIQPELGATDGLIKAIDTANKLNADFVLTGGDLVFDVLRGNRPRGDSLFQLYKETIKRLKMPVYNVIGNHELFGIYEGSGISPADPDYKYGMYKRYLGETFYSFNHKGWHFIALNSIDEKNKKYIGTIGKDQIEWLKKDIAGVSPETPIAIVLHIPLVSVQAQIYPKTDKPEVPNELWVDNRNEVLELFKKHNLRLVLQGHLHWVEDINVGGKTRFITGGAVAGRPSWKGTRTGEEGFMLIRIKGQDINWEYIDYGWETLYRE